MVLGAVGDERDTQPFSTWSFTRTAGGVYSQQATRDMGGGHGSSRSGREQPVSNKIVSKMLVTTIYDEDIPAPYEVTQTKKQFLRACLDIGVSNTTSVSAYLHPDFTGFRYISETKFY